MLHAIQAADESESVDKVAAICIQGLKALIQFGLDGGDWGTAWHLTMLADPYGGIKWAGEESELADVAGVVDAESRLSNALSRANISDGVVTSGNAGAQPLTRAQRRAAAKAKADDK